MRRGKRSRINGKFFSCFLVHIECTCVVCVCMRFVDRRRTEVARSNETLWRNEWDEKWKMNHNWATAQWISKNLKCYRCAPYEIAFIINGYHLWGGLGNSSTHNYTPLSCFSYYSSFDRHVDTLERYYNKCVTCCCVQFFFDRSRIILKYSIYFSIDYRSVYVCVWSCMGDGAMCVRRE